MMTSFVEEFVLLLLFVLTILEFSAIDIFGNVTLVMRNDEEEILCAGTKVAFLLIPQTTLPGTFSSAHTCGES